MKISFILRVLFVSCFALYFASCKEDDLLTEDAVGEGAALINVGTPGGDTDIGTQTWTNNNVYFLNGLVRVPNGQTLTIQPGTEIRGRGATNGVAGTLIIERGGRLLASATASQPIVFTSDKPRSSRQPGDWGGVILAGRAYANVKAGTQNPTNPSPVNYIGSIEGIPSGRDPILYGSGSADRGANINDDSGILRYVRIEFAGNTLSEGNETNGLTLGGVGRGTIIDHVQVSYANDDGFEWFGGSVDCKYLLCYRNRDDDFDMDQGYFGKLQFGFAIKDRAISVAGSGGARGMEINGDVDDAVNTNANAQTDATISNFTIIGPVNPVNQFSNCQNFPTGTDFDYGIAFRDKTQTDVFNSYVIGFPEFQYFFDDDSDNLYWTFAGNIPDALKNRFDVARIPPFPRSSTAGSLARATNIGVNWVSTRPDKPTWPNYSSEDLFEACGGYVFESGLRTETFLLPEFGSQPQPDYRLPSNPVVRNSNNPGQPKPGNVNLAADANFVFPAEIADPFFTNVPFIGAFDQVASGWDINFGGNPNSTWARFVR